MKFRQDIFRAVLLIVILLGSWIAFNFSSWSESREWQAFYKWDFSATGGGVH